MCGLLNSILTTAIAIVPFGLVLVPVRVPSLATGAWQRPQPPPPAPKSAGGTELPAVAFTNNTHICSTTQHPRPSWLLPHQPIAPWPSTQHILINFEPHNLVHEPRSKQAHVAQKKMPMPAPAHQQTFHDLTSTEGHVLLTSPTQK